jgi:anhydro-N-acetylmuramic acid kinase
MDLSSALHLPSPRRVVGLMSGTSLDGIDAVLVEISGRGASVALEQEAFAHVPYPDALRSLVRANTTADGSSVEALTRLDARLAEAYATATDQVLAEADRSRAALDLVGTHGQTMCHRPAPAACAGMRVRSTLQLGNPSALAARLGVPVVGNFRAADLALGGQGAPLVPYFDAVAFAAPEEHRALLNLGGIANLTLLPAGGALDAVQAFDTGPGNMVIDALATRLYDAPYDPSGRHAGAGTPHHDLLADLLTDAYFRRSPPKSTGRGDFGAAYVDRLLGAADARGLEADDTMATATLLTAASVYQAYAQHVRTHRPIDVLIASGGGVHNDTLMRMLRDAFAPIPVRTTADYGISPDAKEALCFALLAHALVNGTPTNLPAVTGASGRARLGSLSLPPANSD